MDNIIYIVIIGISMAFGYFMWAKVLKKKGPQILTISFFAVILAMLIFTPMIFMSSSGGSSGPSNKELRDLGVTRSEYNEIYADVYDKTVNN